MKFLVVVTPPSIYQYIGNMILEILNGKGENGSMSTARMAHMGPH